MAKTLKFGGGVWATKKGSTLAYNDEGGNFKPLPFTYTGAGKGTRVNKEGLIEVVENDRPRVDYKDSEDGVFLLEKASTNLIPYSEDFSNSGWTKNNTTVIGGFKSPDGNLNAYKITDNSNINKHGIYDLDVLPQDSNIYTRSVFVKKGTARYVVLSARHLPTSSGTSWIYDFDINNWILIGSTGVGQSIEDYGNGWIRLSISHISDSNFNNDFSVGISTGSTISDTTYSGIGDTLYVYGAQIELGNLSSYIPTQGSASTRVAETASGSGNSEVFSDSQGVLFANIAANADDGTKRRISINNGSSSQFIQLEYRPTSNTIQVGVYNGSSQGYFTELISDVTLYNKIAYLYQQNNFKLYVSGFQVGETITIGTTFSSGVLKNLSFDNGAGGDDFYGKTKEIAYYNEILTDLELETLTSYRSWEAMVKELNLNIIHNE